ncbi:hypothetical protein PF003_g40722 [Phytophthora fragariae]|nr:hypothetical protein PF003_g40722 [Phytophthora fragariae]
MSSTQRRQHAGQASSHDVHASLSAVACLLHHQRPALAGATTSAVCCTRCSGSACDARTDICALLPEHVSREASFSSIAPGEEG